MASALIRQINLCMLNKAALWNWYYFKKWLLLVISQIIRLELQYPEYQTPIFTISCLILSLLHVTCRFNFELIFT